MGREDEVNMDAAKPSYEELEAKNEELQAEVEDQELRIDDLEYQVSDLEEELAELRARKVSSPHILWEKIQGLLEWRENPNTANPETRKSVEEALFSSLRRELLGG